MRNVGQPFSFLYVVAVLLIATVSGIVFDSATAERLTREGNLIENLTVVLYLGVIAYLLFVASGNRRFRYHSALVVLLFVLRELDMHRRLVSGSILNFSYYLQPSTSLVERAIAGVVMLTCAYVLVSYVTYGRSLLSGLRNRHGYALTTAAALLILLITKLLDSASRILRENFAIILSSEVKIPMRVLEETLEFGIPLLILLACLQHKDFYSRTVKGNP